MKLRRVLFVAVAFTAIAAAIGVGSRRAALAGDDSASSPAPGSASGSADEGEIAFEGREGLAYQLGPGAIEFEQQTPAEQAHLTALGERLDTAQPAASVDAFTSAAQVTSSRAQAEIAARAVGLEGSDEDGVVP